MSRPSDADLIELLASYEAVLELADRSRQQTERLLNAHTAGRSLTADEVRDCWQEVERERRGIEQLRSLIGLFRSRVRTH